MINSPTVYLSQVLVGDIQQRGCAPGKAGEGGGCRAPPPATAWARAGESRGPPGARLGAPDTQTCREALGDGGGAGATLCCGRSGQAESARGTFHAAAEGLRRDGAGNAGRVQPGPCSSAAEEQWWHCWRPSPRLSQLLTQGAGEPAPNTARLSLDEGADRRAQTAAPREVAVSSRPGHLTTAKR